MKLVELKGICKYYGQQILFEDVSFNIKEGEKVVVLGHNGAGKSTLLKIIEGIESFDSGYIFRNANLKISSLNQIDSFSGNLIVEDILNQVFGRAVVLEEELNRLAEDISNDYTEKSFNEYSKALQEFEALGGYDYLNQRSMFFDDFNLNRFLHRVYRTLSGGEQQYVRLAVALFSYSNLLILDEPLNYLDYRKIKWLGEYIRCLNKAVIVVSHDTKFISNFGTHIIAVKNWEVNKYTGDYQTCLRLESKAIQKKKSTNSNSHQAITRLNESIEQQMAWRDRAPEPHRYSIIIKRLTREMKKEQTRIKKFEKLKDYEFNYLLPKLESQTDQTILLETIHLKKSFGNKVIFKDLNFSLKDREHIMILGENGIGKTTFLELLQRIQEPDDGIVEYYAPLSFSYINQTPLFRDDKMKVKDYLMYEMKISYDQAEKAIMEFYPSMEFFEKRIFMLSVGERRRLQLLAALLTQNTAKENILILDEPTAHMDAYTKSKVLDLINSYSMSLILVTHDSEIINTFAGTVYRMKRSILKNEEENTELERENV